MATDAGHRLSRSNVWLGHYLNSNNPETFFNGTAAAKAAGYQCEKESGYHNIARQNKRKWEGEIARWLDDEGLGITELKQKLLALLHAKETKFFAHMGTVIEQREVDALDIQRKALEMALKIKGQFPNTNKVELSGPDGGPINTQSRVTVRYIRARDVEENADLF